VPTHWTYDACEPGDHLFQGDVIARSEPLLQVLRLVHDHFADPKYLAFLVITQTCDLVPRKKARCKAKHINLAVIRSLEDLVPDLFTELGGTDVNGVYTQESKEEARQMLERILNQNEQAHGMFYLHPDGDVGIAVPAVSLLRVSIALRSHEHYGLLRESRCGRLSTEYRNKLGWLTGNLFSRVDTRDWPDHEGGAEEIKRLIVGFLDGSSLPTENIWAPLAWIQAARRNNVELGNLPRDQIYPKLQEHAPASPSETVIARVRDIGSRVLDQIGDDDLKELGDRLTGNIAYSILICERVSDIAISLFGDGSPQVATLSTHLRDDGAFGNALYTTVAEAITRFSRRRGARDLTICLADFAGALLLSDAAVQRAVSFVTTFEDLDVERINDFMGLLRAERPSAPIVDFVRSLAHEVMHGSFIKRLISRLDNDQTVRAALKEPSRRL
jgi:hypothetical protein